MRCFYCENMGCLVLRNFLVSYSHLDPRRNRAGRIDARRRVVVLSDLHRALEPFGQRKVFDQQDRCSH